MACFGCRHHSPIGADRFLLNRPDRHLSQRPDIAEPAREPVEVEVRAVGRRAVQPGGDDRVEPLGRVVDRVGVSAASAAVVLTPVNDASASLTDSLIDTLMSPSKMRRQRAGPSALTE